MSDVQPQLLKEAECYSKIDHKVLPKEFKIKELTETEVHAYYDFARVFTSKIGEELFYAVLIEDMWEQLVFVVFEIEDSHVEALGETFSSPNNYLDVKEVFKNSPQKYLIQVNTGNEVLKAVEIFDPKQVFDYENSEFLWFGE